MKKRFLSILLCVCMTLSRMPMLAWAAGTTYNISTGALTINSGNSSAYNNAVITGTVSSEYEQLTIDGVTVSLTIEDLSITMTGYRGNASGITLQNNATLNLTVKGTNVLTGAYGGAGIDVPQGCTLNITAESTGTLTTTGGNSYGGGAGIGAVGNQWVPPYTSTVTQSVGTIHVAGGTIIATGGTTYSGGAVVGAAGIGGSPESTTGVISISGGTVTATGGYGAAGIGGGYNSCVESITIESGTVTATGDIYGSAIGSGYNGYASGKELSCGTIAISGGAVAVDGNIGYGAATSISSNVGGTVSIESGAGVTIKNCVISPSAADITTYPLSVTIYDGRLIDSIANASFTIGGTAYLSSINVSENYVGTLSCSLVVVNGTLTGTQATTVSGGGYSWADISCSENAGSYSAEIGEKLYPVFLWFYDPVITADITGASVSAQRSGVPLNADSEGGIVQLVCDGTIAKQQDGIGKMTVWMTAGAETELFVTVSGLKDGSAMSKGSQTVKASSDGTTIILHDTGEMTQLSAPLDLSYGSITFAENGGKLNIIYTPTSGGVSTTVTGQYYQNEYEIIQTNSGTTATTNQIIFQNTTDFVKVKLNGVNMSSQGKSIDLQTAKAQLNLSGTNIIECGGAAYNDGDKYNPNLFYMGIHAAEGSALTIGGSGSLEVRNPSYYGAGIGGYYCGTFMSGSTREGAGAIRIQGGTLTVSGQRGAGIGSSFFYSGSNPGSIEIAGGTVIATSNTGAAIGGGESGGCPDITISGGTVTANRIGAGSSGSGGSLAVTGGTVSTASGEKPSINVIVTGVSDEAVYYTNANVNAIYGTSAAVTNASFTDYSYGFNDVKTDGSGSLHLFLPASGENAKTTADFNGVTYDGTISSTEPNTLKKYVPLAVSIDDVTNTGATLHATADSGNTIYYVASDTALSEGSAVESAEGAQSVAASGGSDTITLSGLTEGTAYTYYLTAKEENDYSDVAAVTFTTLFAAPNASEISVDYAGDLLKAASGLGYTLEYALSADAATWTEITTEGIGLTDLLDNHTGTEDISIYIRKNVSDAVSEAVSVSIPARPDCSVSTLSINCTNETITIPSSVQYQFAASVPDSWASAVAGADDSAVSLKDKISAAGTSEESLYKVHFRNPATDSAFASKTASVAIPARPETPAAPSAASIAETSVTLTAVTGAEYSKDGTSWQDSTEFSGISVNTGHTFYQRVKATESSFASLSSSTTITTAKNSIAAATVMLTDCDSFTYDGTEKTPTVTVTLNETQLDSSQYMVSYSNSNGDAGDHTNASTVTVTVTASPDGDYSGTVSQTEGMAYTIGKAPLTITAAAAAGRKYDGTNQVSISAVTLDGIVNSDDVRAYAVENGTISGADVETYELVTLPTMYLIGAAAGNYTLTQPTAPVSTIVSITQADALSLTGNAAMVKNQVDYTKELDLTQISGYPAVPGGTPVFTVSSAGSYNGLTAATVDGGGRLTLAADNTANTTQDIVTISVTGMGNYTDSTITVTVNYTDKIPVSITGLSAPTGRVYNGSEVTNADFGIPVLTPDTYNSENLTYTYYNGSSASEASIPAPKDAGTYTVRIAVAETDEDFAGYCDITFVIDKATVTAIADNKSMIAGDTLPAFTVSYTGIASGETVGSIFTTPAIASCEADGNTEGSYPILAAMPVLTEAAANNYIVATTVSGTLTVNNDTTAPEVSFGTDGNETWSALAASTVTVTDAESGVDAASLKYAWSTDTDEPSSGWTSFTNGDTLTKSGSDGDWYLHIQAADAFGNVTNAVSGRFRLDNTASTVILLSPQGTNVPVSVSDIILGFSEEVSGVENKKVTISDGTDMYIYTIGVSDDNISVTDSVYRATIPVEWFVKDTETLILEYDTEYTIEFEAGAYIDAAGNGEDSGNIGSFKTEKESYTVAFKDWDETVLNTQTVIDGSKATSPANPVRAGYSFAGWYVDKAYAALFDFNTAITDEQTLYAKWTKVDSNSGDSDKKSSNRRNPALEKPRTSKTAEASLSKTAIEAARSSRKALVLTTPLASISFDAQALDSIAEQIASAVTFSVVRVDPGALGEDARKLVGDRPVYDFSVTSERRTISQFGGKATVSIPYKPTAEELRNPEHITIWHIDGSGKAVPVPSGRYDVTTGTVTFATTHFSRYAVVYVQKSFSDLESTAWARKQIEVLASKGIMEGRTDNEFAPQAGITRAEYMAALVRTFGVTAKSDTNFNDVAAGSRYYEEIAIARKLGISNGSGNNCFKPEDTITRQDMLVLTERALRSLDKLSSTGTAADLERFADRAEVKDYAAASIAALVKEGLIEGSSGRLNVKADTTRAEAAVFLYRLYNR